MSRQDQSRKKTPLTKMENKALKQITDNVRGLIQESPTAEPGRLSEILVELSSLNASLSEELDNILIFKPERKQDLRSQFKTVAETNWAWDASPEGKKELYLRGWLNRIKENKSAIKSRLNIIHDQAFNQF